MLLYTAYCAAVTVAVIKLVPHYDILNQLKALQFPIQTLGAAEALSHSSWSCKLC